MLDVPKRALAALALMLGLSLVPTAPAQAIASPAIVRSEASVSVTAIASVTQIAPAAASSKTLWAKYSYVKTSRKVGTKYEYRRTVRVGYKFTVVPADSTATRWKVKGRNEYVAKSSVTSSEKSLWGDGKLGRTYARVQAWRLIHSMAKAKGWNTDKQYACANNVVKHEGAWKRHARNPSSGAYGIYQALPGSKMKSAGNDWKDNPNTQNKWGIKKYMTGRYGSPCAAWRFWQSHGWY
jgi:hypothetical protein